MKYCLQCLSGKTKFNDPNHICADKWVCKNISHVSYQKKLHFLVCELHSKDDENMALFGVFQIEVLTADWQRKLFQGKSGFVSRHTTLIGCKAIEDKPKETDMMDQVIADKSQCGTPTFLLQPVPFHGHVFRFMFDNGCEGFLSRKAAVDLLPDKCKENIMPGPLKIRGVGDTLVTVPHGYWTVRLPIHTGQLAQFSGMCMEVITGKMPPYPVREARKELVAQFEADGNDGSTLPQVPMLVGGETDFLFGQQYNWYAPRLLHILPTGLAIYESMFMGLDDTRGCMGGPSKLFEQAERQFLESHPAHDFRVYLQQALSLYRTGIRICVDVDSLSSENMLFPAEVAVVDEDEDQEAGGPVVLLSSKPKLVNVCQTPNVCSPCKS